MPFTKQNQREGTALKQYEKLQKNNKIISFLYDLLSSNKSQLWLLIVVAGLLNITSVAAFTTDNKAADELLYQFKSEQFTNPLIAQEKLLELETIIKDNDSERQSVLKTYQCRAIRSFETEKLQAFIDSTSDINQQQFYSLNIPVLLNLCRSKAFRYLGQQSQAIEINQAALDQAIIIDDKDLLASVYNNIGQQALYQGLFLQAVDSISQSFELHQELDLRYSASLNLLDLASAYRRLGDNDKAMYYFNIIEKYFSETNNLTLLANVEHSLAYIKLDSGEYLQSIEYFKKVYELTANLENPLFTAKIAVDISAPLIKLGQLEEAEQWLIQAKPQITPEVYSHYAYMQAYLLELTLIQGKYEEALIHFQEAKNNFTKNNNKKGLAITYQLASQLFAAQKDYQAANSWHHQFLTIHEELDQARLATYNSEMRLRFDSKTLEDKQTKLIEFKALKDSQLAALNTKQYLQYIALSMTFTFAIILLLSMVKLMKKSQQYRQMALTDPLTQIPNRLYAYNVMHKLLKQKNHFSVLLFDVDHFKNVNDTYGHDVGDQILQLIAVTGQQLCRQQDTIARIGGEEFLIILPNSNAEQAMTLAKSINVSINLIDCPQVSEDLTFSASIGIATVSEETIISAILKKADIALYSAKNSGRNCFKHYRDVVSSSNGEHVS
ncbi:tetratricopeptide repeat-containing diguanylate cyclase [Shewanella donghaensis]|uniref:tetratricopeptide repeat-containing diguanylate cyclase n=1 Tax=Shewanella donghaensis TaxID=238836 RepID=UPI001182FD6E|nr:GGDEF domain-containing protein [Shewanella donghaensis]